MNINVMALLRASLRRACGRQDISRAEVPFQALDEPNAGSVLRAATALTVVRPGVAVSGDVNDYVTLTWP